MLRDLGSANGTWVNGTRVHGQRVLAPGDVVQIGTFRLTYDGDSLDSFDQRGAIRIDARDVERDGAGQACCSTRRRSRSSPCEFVAIVGASGAGKSTLMMALCGFQRATAGTITINGDDLYAGYDAYRSIVGYVPQDDILHRTLTVEPRAAPRGAPAAARRHRRRARSTRASASVLDGGRHDRARDKRIDQLSRRPAQARVDRVRAARPIRRCCSSTSRPRVSIPGSSAS